jgi:hypothetical protein
MWHRQDTGFGVACYRLREVIRGNFATNDIWINYWADTLTNNLPDDAVLVVTPFVKNRGFAAIGFDARFGILSNTAPNLSRVRTATTDELAPVPMSNWINKATAITIVDKFATEKHSGESNLVWIANRAGYAGWAVFPGGKCPLVNTTNAPEFYLIEDDRTIRLPATGQVFRN